jgi:hypothetical protein
MPSQTAYETRLRSSFSELLREAGGYFAGQGALLDTVRRLAARLDEHGITYAVIGGIALGQHGVVRMTEDINILMTADGLEQFHQRCVGLGYTAAFPGAQKTFRDTETGVRIEVVATGEFPGDGRPKPVVFPDPVDVSVEHEGIRIIQLSTFLDLKLVSGMTAAHRLQDLADVQHVIKRLGLTEDVAEQIHPYVQEEYRRLWRAVQEGLEEQE